MDWMWDREGSVLNRTVSYIHCTRKTWKKINKKKKKKTQKKILKK